jgi:hypothetical protein
MTTTISNLEKFRTELESQYVRLFETPEYEFSASRTTPKALADKMVYSLKVNGANKDGKGIKNTCKVLGIKNTYKGIFEYLNS